MKIINRFAVACLMSMVSVAAFAQEVGADYSTITSAADWSSVTTGVMAVAAALVGVLVAARGARVLLGFIRR